MLTPQYLLPLSSKLIIDLFAGGGGASTGIEQAIGRHVDIAINHDAEAIAMHEMNHPQTKHYRADIREVCPNSVTHGQEVGLLHASPDCTDHSQAKGGQPRDKATRSLAWQVHRWVGKTKPDLVSMENVPIQTKWSPLIAKRDPATGRVLTLDTVIDPSTKKKAWRVAAPGEVVPRRNQYLVPDKTRLGTQWRRFVEGLRNMGYEVQWRVICNADLGAHSTRKRLYLLARRDGLPIVWPKQTHAKQATPHLRSHRPASDCIDWKTPCKSIFERKKPLSEASLNRIAHGIERFIVKSSRPFLLNQDQSEVLAAFMVQANGGFNKVPARDLRHAMSTVTTTGSQQQLCVAKLREYQTADHENAMQCAAFLMRYHGSGGQWSNLHEPMTTVTTRDRLALVTVWFTGKPWVIVDIALRMLKPRELYRGQDFPDTYVIDRTTDGTLTKTAQVRMAGNSVSPIPMRLLIAANYNEQAELLAA